MSTILTPERQAHIYATGLLWLISIGTLATIALSVAAIWLLVELAQLLLAGIVEGSRAIDATFAAADPFVRLLILASLGYLAYRVARKLLRR
jgi:hypothetical protein